MTLKFFSVIPYLTLTGVSDIKLLPIFHLVKHHKVILIPMQNAWHRQTGKGINRHTPSGR